MPTMPRNPVLPLLAALLPAVAGALSTTNSDSGALVLAGFEVSRVAADPTTIPGADEPGRGGGGEGRRVGATFRTSCGRG